MASLRYRESAYMSSRGSGFRKLVRMCVRRAKCSSADLASWSCISSTSRECSLAGAPRISERVPVARAIWWAIWESRFSPAGSWGKRRSFTWGYRSPDEAYTGVVCRPWNVTMTRAWGLLYRPEFEGGNPPVPAAGMKMVPNRIRLSAVGRSRRLIVEARGFRGSAPVSVFYFAPPKSILTAGAWPVRKTAGGRSIEFAQAPRVGGVFQVFGGFDQLVRVAGQLAGVGFIGVLGAVRERGLAEGHHPAE